MDSWRVGAAWERTPLTVGYFYEKTSNPAFDGCRLRRRLCCARNHLGSKFPGDDLCQCWFAGDGYRLGAGWIGSPVCQPKNRRDPNRQERLVLPTLFATVSPVFLNSECGLIGIGFDPNFMVNGYLYVFCHSFGQRTANYPLHRDRRCGTNKTVWFPIAHDGPESRWRCRGRRAGRQALLGHRRQRQWHGHQCGSDFVGVQSRTCQPRWQCAADNPSLMVRAVIMISFGRAASKSVHVHFPTGHGRALGKLRGHQLRTDFPR